jgi:hypothetical protein
MMTITHTTVAVSLVAIFIAFSYGRCIHTFKKRHLFYSLVISFVISIGAVIAISMVHSMCLNLGICEKTRDTNIYDMLVPIIIFPVFFIPILMGYSWKSSNVEFDNNLVYTDIDKIEMFESEYKVKLPKEYIDYFGTNSSFVVKLPPCHSEATEFYFGEGFYEIGKFSNLDRNEENSLFNSSYLVDTWDLPEKLVPIDGDGSTWLALDYRNSSTNPKVVVIETDGYESLVVAKTFKEFTQSLLAYESVYDADGQIIYNG